MVQVLNEKKRKSNLTENAMRNRLTDKHNDIIRKE
jgi:hypothetical protein